MSRPPMTQDAPYPTLLEGLVAKLTYKDSWSFRLGHEDRGQESVGLTLTITVLVPNSYHPDRQIAVCHYMIVPPAAYDERNWRRWLFNQILLVEQHEAMEFFTVDGEKPYAPRHGEGNDPYTVVEYGLDVDRRTSFRNVVTE